MTEFGRIYIIKNKINNKVYVGQTKVSIKLRFQNHLSAARCGKDYIIGKAIRKYGEENFYIELLEECLASELNEREMYWIAFYNATDNKCGYNMSLGGNVNRKPTQIDEDLVLKLFKEGNSAQQITKMLHTNTYNISNVLKKHNITYGIDLQRTPKDKTIKVIQLYQEGYSSIQISNNLGINKSTVLRILKRNNIPTRTFKETKNLGRNLPTLQ